MIYAAEDTNKKLKVRVLAFCGSGNGPIMAVCCREDGRLYTTEVENILVPGNTNPSPGGVFTAPAGTDLKAKPGSMTPIDRKGRRT